MSILNMLSAQLLTFFSIPYFSVKKNEIFSFSVFKMHGSILYLYEKILPP